MIYADFHIHIGRSLNGKAVKITASPNLTLPEIINFSAKVKGLHMIGIVDSHSVGVRKDYQELLFQGILRPLESGGYHAGSLVIIPGMEVELKVGEGHAHFLSFFPSISHLESFLKEVKPFTKNWQLSTQKLYIDVQEWIERVEKSEGIWLPAHAFTPHKGIYGACCKKMEDVLPKLPYAVEMGLSADRNMTMSLSETDGMLLFSNSDAHSLPNIAREYNQLDLNDNSFSGLNNLFKNISGKLIRNFGMHPKMGKYHRSFCTNCSKIVDTDPPAVICPCCSSERIILGVLDRLNIIADRSSILYQDDPRYIYRVPLGALPGIGRKRYTKLLEQFGSELAVYHEANLEDLTSIAGEKAAKIILKAREGKLEFSAGGGGYYGKVVDIVS